MTERQIIPPVTADTRFEPGYAERAAEAVDALLAQEVDDGDRG